MFLIFSNQFQLKTLFLYLLLFLLFRLTFKIMNMGNPKADKSARIETFWEDSLKHALGRKHVPHAVINTNN